jgi:hypothetical protein
MLPPACPAGTVLAVQNHWFACGEGDVCPDVCFGFCEDAVAL